MRPRAACSVICVLVLLASAAMVLLRCAACGNLLTAHHEWRSEWGNPGRLQMLLHLALQFQAEVDRGPLILSRCPASRLCWTILLAFQSHL